MRRTRKQSRGITENEEEIKKKKKKRMIWWRRRRTKPIIAAAINLRCDLQSVQFVKNHVPFMTRNLDFTDMYHIFVVH